MKKYLACGAACAALLGTTAVHAAAFPGIGSNTAGPALIITLNPNGTATIAAGPSSGPYDNSEDTYIGVVNNSGHTVSSINIHSSQDIFGFDGDGIDASQFLDIAHNAQDSTGYGGPNGFFTNITSVGGVNSGTVNWIGGIANGGQDFFSLEEPLSAADFQGATGGIKVGGVPEPATWAMMLVGFFGLGGMMRAKRRAAALA
jgi:hypothetical protein